MHHTHADFRRQGRKDHTAKAKALGGRAPKAMGGEAKSDEKSDKAMIKRAMHAHDSQQHGGKRTRLPFKDGGGAPVPGESAAKPRLDRAGGGSSKKSSGKKHGTNVNVVVAPGGGGGGGQPPAPHPMMPPPAPHPPIAPPGGMPPGAAPAGGPPIRPPGMPPAGGPPGAGIAPMGGFRSHGGAVGFKHGGGVKEEGGSELAHDGEGVDLHGKGMVHLHAGSKSGEGRLEKIKIQKAVDKQAVAEQSKEPT